MVFIFTSEETLMTDLLTGSPINLHYAFMLLWSFFVLFLILDLIVVSCSISQVPPADSSIEVFEFVSLKGDFL